MPEMAQGQILEGPPPRSEHVNAGKDAGKDRSGKGEQSIPGN